MKTLRLPFALGLGTLGVVVACTSGSSSNAFEVDRDSDYRVGDNYKDGKVLRCEYADTTVLRVIETAPPRGETTLPLEEVMPGLRSATRGSVAGDLKQQVIERVRANSPAVKQLGSCNLRCVEVPKPAYPSYADAGASYPGPADRASQASTTNNQVAGVDEADFIKNDDKYMYVAANGVVKIIDAFPAASAQVLSTVQIRKGKPTQLFLGNNRLVVYSAVAAGSAPFGGSPGTCTYGFDCVPTGDGSSTHVTILDITNKAAPVVLRELDFSGALISARKVGDAIHSVVYDAPLTEKLQALASPVQLDKACYDTRDNVDEVAAKVRRAVDEKVAAILAASDGGPQIADGASPIEPTFRRSNAPGNAYLSLVSFGISGEAARAETVVSRPGFTYASSSALYISVPHKRGEDSSWYANNNSGAASEVYKFAIGASPSATRYQASGLVKGTVLNQFAMDEWGGNLRIATTSGRTPDPDVHSTVTVLEAQGGTLMQKGMVDNIAPTEDMRSVRFDGDRAFLVTFKKTDPLFAVDLSAPTAPRIAGELKIPGFSTYMHFMDRTHLLAMGLEADDQGSFAYFNGIQLQIFDVANMAQPTLLHKTVIGTRGSSSDALTNHLAFNYFAPKGLLALPITVCEGGGDGRYGTMTFNGLKVFSVSTDTGFTARGGIAHPTVSGATCSNWWTNQNTSVKRSVIMDDFVYSVAQDVINVANVADLSTPVTSVSLK